MLHLIPPPLHRAGLRLAHGIRRRWWRLRSPRLAGCRVIALDLEGRVLLIRHSYGSDKWMPPGGGIGRGEDPLTAAIRELREETACRLENARTLALSHEDLHGAANRVHIVCGLTRDQPVADGREIIEAAFFALGDLPHALPNRLRAQLPEWVTAASAGHLRDGAHYPPGLPTPRE